MKLNLGAGGTVVSGYQPRDGAKGDVLFPLPDASGSADEIRASHVLEHFPKAQIPAVLADWVRVLKPGGLLKVAVPDFGAIAQAYVNGGELPVEGYVMGGQVDERDYHKALFDANALTAALEHAGLLNVRRWKSEVADCAALPISLNLQGNKPAERWPKVAAVISMPRLGFNDFWACAYQHLAALDITLRKVTGAYWDRDLSMGIERVLDEENPEWVLTCDYDTVFTKRQVLGLLDVARRYPHADAIAPLQTARHHAAPMFTARLPSGEVLQHIDREQLVHGEVIRAETAHFGLTLLRASALRTMPKPWFPRAYDAAGGHGEGSRDPDVAFWHGWKADGHSLYVALRVPVGHCELMVRWPDVNLEAAFQRASDFWSDGPPANLWR